MIDTLFRVTRHDSRRQFLQWLAASPLAAAAQTNSPSPNEPYLLKSPQEAINVLEFEAVAKQKLPPAHFAYMATGVDDDATLRANRAGFDKFKLRPRRLVDVRDLDTKRTLFGSTLECPIIIAPTGNQMAFHPQAELAVAKAAGATKTQMMLSTVTNTKIEDVMRAVASPIWYQLYATQRWEVTEQLVRHAEQAGATVIALTIDTNSGRRTDTLERAKRYDTRQCSACHTPTYGFNRKPMFDGIDTEGLTTGNPGMDWKFVDKLRRFTKVKFILKGLETAEDARLAVDAGVDGLIVSNHGARATETGRGTIECLPEVIEAVEGRMPVLIDGGFRRGTDIFKALALGASAVCVGRPYLWGLASFGQPGVEQVLRLLRTELELIMRQCGTRTLADIKPAHVMRG